MLLKFRYHAQCLPYKNRTLARMNLDDFFPYRLALLSEAVSRATSLVYAERFGLGRDEWRILAALANRTSTKTSELISLTTMDKMQVSRALARLVSDGLVDRRVDPKDRRGHELRLRPSGRLLYARIVPKVEERADHLLAELSDTERQQLMRSMDLVLDRARSLIQSQSQSPGQGQAHKTS